MALTHKQKDIIRSIYRASDKATGWAHVNMQTIKLAQELPAEYVEIDAGAMQVKLTEKAEEVLAQ